MSTGKTARAKTLNRAQVSGGERMRAFADKANSISTMMIDSLKGYGDLYADTVRDSGERLIQGRGLSVGDLLADAAALSFEGIGAAADVWKSAYQICCSSETPERAPREGVGIVFFQIDHDTECTSPLALGGVKRSEFDILEKTDLKRTGGQEVIPKQQVSLTTDKDDILIALASLGTVVPNLPPGLYRGEILRRDTATLQATLVVSIEVLLL